MGGSRRYRSFRGGLLSDMFIICLCLDSAWTRAQSQSTHERNYQVVEKPCDRCFSTGGILEYTETIRLCRESYVCDRVTTAFFIFGYCFGLSKHNAAWLHLREATALAQILGMHDPKTYRKGHPEQDTMRQRLFWLLFVTERQGIYLHMPSQLVMNVVQRLTSVP